MKKIFLLLTVPVMLYSCGDTTDHNKTEENKTTDSSKDINNVTTEKVAEGPEFPDATLTIKDVSAKDIANTDSVEVTFNFDVKNYELKAQTPDASSRSCNNSAEGQHIHFILNNQPYTALYEPTHTVRLKKGTSHTLLTFLSRSYHLSLKNPTAYQLMTFRVDDGGQIQKEEAGKEPMIFYSRPKGTYLGADTENVLLDFYLVNADEGVKSGDYKILADIGGKEVNITEWAPFFIKNLPMGRHNISLSLVDKDNKVVGDNKITTEIILAEKEPIMPE